jgi:DNA-binding transcriptional MerR regulator
MDMFIHELAQRTGVSPKTIRYYEAVGLLPPPRRAANQYRLYTEHDATLLNFIVGARNLGYPLSDIARLLAVPENNSLPCQQVLASLDDRLSDIERRIADLQAVRDTLERIRRAAAERPQPQECDDQCVCHLLMKGNAMLTDETPGSEVVIACNPNSIPADMREQWVETGKQVYASVQEVQDIPDGYGFRLPNDSAMLLKVAEYIANERLCCTFIHFTLEIEPNGGPIWLRLTGAEGTKEYMRSVFEVHDLLNQHVARTAGLASKSADPHFVV